LTPRELLLIVEEYTGKRQNDHERMLIYAYKTAEWFRVKRMPSLKDVLESAREKKAAAHEPQTPEQMFAVVKRMHHRLTREEEKKRGRS